VERALEELQDVGLAPTLLERFVGFWKRHGLRKAVVLAIAVTLPLWRYVWIPHALSTGLSTLAESYGAELQVEDWTSDWNNIRVIGEDVVLHARGAYTNQQLLEADGVELDWSLLRGLGNLFERTKALILFRTLPPEEPVHTVTLRRATLHMERLLSGRWNWQDAVEADRVDWSATPLFRIPAIDAERLRLVWVEHLPGNSGGGLIEQTTASLYVDDVRLRATDVMLPQDTRPQAATFTIEGRTGDGRFSATGRVNFARWTPARASSSAGDIVKVSSAAVSWSPTLDLSIYLENVGAAALSRLVSDASLLPTAGSMTGRIHLVVNTEGKLNCKIDLQLRNVQYAPNPRSRYVQARRAQVERDLAEYVVNDHIATECAADWQEPGFRVAKALQAEITGGAVQTASPLVQGAAGYDRLRFVQADPEAVDTFTSDMSTKIGAAIGGQRGAAVAQALTAPHGQEGNAVTRGLKSVGRGFKRLFGGRESTPSKKKPQ
jgi:hypothetical protein